MFRTFNDVECTTGEFSSRKCFSMFLDGCRVQLGLRIDKMLHNLSSFFSWARRVYWRMHKKLLNNFETIFDVVCAHAAFLLFSNLRASTFVKHRFPFVEEETRSNVFHSCQVARMFVSRGVLHVFPNSASDILLKRRLGLLLYWNSRIRTIWLFVGVLVWKFEERVNM